VRPNARFRSESGIAQEESRNILERRLKVAARSRALGKKRGKFPENLGMIGAASRGRAEIYIIISIWGALKAPPHMGFMKIEIGRSRGIRQQAGSGQGC
jgi:hypothetical protein